MQPVTTHHPPHLYLDDHWYVITSSICGGHRLLHPEGHKEMVRDHLKTLVLQFKLTLAAWVILDNHCHLLVKSRRGADLPRFIGRLHGRTSFDLNQLDHTPGRQMWHNYWDTAIPSEEGYWTRFNYIHQNPVKHGYVERMEAWPYSSCGYYLAQKGEAWLMDVLERYPVVDFSEPSDGFGHPTS